MDFKSRSGVMDNVDTESRYSAICRVSLNRNRNWISIDPNKYYTIPNLRDSIYNDKIHQSRIIGKSQNGKSSSINKTQANQLENIASSHFTFRILTLPR